MKLINLERDGLPRPGMVLDGDAVDLVAASALVESRTDFPSSVRQVLDGGANMLGRLRRIGHAIGDSDTIRDQLRAGRAMVEIAEAKLLAPITDPGLVLSCGLNYHAHLDEMNTPAPDRPSGFTKNAAQIIGPGAAIVLPARFPDMVDWEGELTVVMGRACHNVSADEALDYVAGYTIANDVSARNWVAPVFTATGRMGPIHAWEHNLLGKQLPTFCPLGPWIVTADEIADPGKLKLTTTVNGTVMQSSTTSDFVFNIPKLISYYSQFYLFRPGDLITTGSPPGVGFGRKPPIFLKPNDIVEVWVERIGTLSNPVAAPPVMPDRCSSRRASNRAAEA